MYYNWRKSRAQLARRALVTGNPGKDPVPVEVLERWLAYIENVTKPEGCAGCGDRQLGVGAGGCGWACLTEREAS